MGWLRLRKEEGRTVQAMRGRALRPSGRAVRPRAPRGLARASRPLHPRPRGALLLVGSPASERFTSETADQRVRPFGCRAEGALLPRNPAPTAHAVEMR